LKKHFKGALCPTEKELDVTYDPKLWDYFKEHQPDVVIHCAAMTDVSECEDDSFECFVQNAEGTLNVAMCCDDFDAKMIFISTDHVFSGVRGYYVETDQPKPSGVYAKSKLIGEWFTLANPNNLVIRTSFMKDFPFKKAYTDKFASLMWVEDAAKEIAKAVKMDLKGIYHIAGERKSIYDFVKERYPKVKKMEIKERPTNDSGLEYLKDTSLVCDKWRQTCK